jgi:hypothetical protein
MVWLVTLPIFTLKHLCEQIRAMVFQRKRRYKYRETESSWPLQEDRWRRLVWLMAFAPLLVLYFAMVIWVF